MSDTDESSVQGFVAGNSDPEQGGNFSSRIKGGVWYSVLHGAYPDYESAKGAVERLPPSLRKLKPWIRKVESIRKRMRR